MKTIWNVVSFLAVVHLLALVMFLGWLWNTDRLDGQRVRDLKAMFALTLTDAEIAAEAAALEAEARRLADAVEVRAGNPPLPSGERIGVISTTLQEDERANRHLENVRRQLLQQFHVAAQQIELDREALETEQAGLAKGIGADQQRRADTQLAKAVKLLESLPPKQAKQKIVELVQSGRTDEAVVYLDTMNPRNAGKVFAEFKTAQENKLATELLERIRTLGLRSRETGALKDTSDANTVANAR